MINTPNSAHDIMARKDPSQQSLKVTSHSRTPHEDPGVTRKKFEEIQAYISEHETKIVRLKNTIDAEMILCEASDQNSLIRSVLESLVEMGSSAPTWYGC